MIGSCCHGSKHVSGEPLLRAARHDAMTSRNEMTSCHDDVTRTSRDAARPVSMCDGQTDGRTHARTTELASEIRTQSITGHSIYAPLTVESYKVIICRLPTVILIIIGIPSTTHSFIPGLIPSFSANPSHRSLFFFRHGFRRLFTVTCEHIPSFTF